jgi:AraC-like DNA-binding protein
VRRSRICQSGPWLLPLVTMNARFVFSMPPYAGFRDVSKEMLPELRTASLLAVVLEPPIAVPDLTNVMSYAATRAHNSTVGGWIPQTVGLDLHLAVAAAEAGAAFVTNGIDTPDILHIRSQILDSNSVPRSVVRWVFDQGRVEDETLRNVLRRIVGATWDDSRLTEISASFDTSNRTLRRAFRKNGLPPPRAWAVLGRALRVVVHIQKHPDTPIAVVAFKHGYYDARSLARQLARLFNIAPSLLRNTLGIDWLLNRWAGRVPLGHS